MKKISKKGFTLVELLAVIVILGVLLLIAVPAAQNIITTNKKKAFVRNIQLVANQLANYKTLYPNEKNCIYFFGGNVNVRNEKVSSDASRDYRTFVSLDKGSLDDIVGYFYIDNNWTIYFVHARDLKNYFYLGGKKDGVLAGVIQFNANDDLSKIDSDYPIKTPDSMLNLTKYSEISTLDVRELGNTIYNINNTNFLPGVSWPKTSDSNYNSFRCDFR